MKFFPTGGWGYNWVGDPNGGLGRRQPGGWIFSYFALHRAASAMFDMGKGQGSPAQSPNSVNDQRIQTPIPTLNCPSRAAVAGFCRTCCGMVNADNTSLKARADYAANLGDSQQTVFCFALHAGIFGPGYRQLYLARYHALHWNRFRP